MGLLTSLGLKPSKAMAKQTVTPAGSPKDTPAPNGKPSAEKPKAVGTVAQPEDPARQAALALANDLKARLKAAQADYAKLADGQEKLKKFIATTQGDQKRALEGKQKLLDQKVADAEKAVDQLHTDVEALANPGTQREEFVAILARAKSKATIGAATEIDLKAESLDKKPLERHETKTTTAFADGKAVTTKEENKRTVGLDGVTVTKSKEREETTADSTLKTSQEKKTQVGPKGVSLEEKKKVEVERDGKTVSLEKGSSTEIGKEGVTKTNTTTFTRSDGSSTATETSGGIERGDGKLGGALGKTKTETDAAGTATSKGAKGKAGLMAGDKGYGGFAEGEGKFSKESKSGFKTGAVAGLNANIVCNIGDPEGEPALYPLTLEVNLGGAITLSTGQGKKDAAVKGGVEAKVGATVYMKQKHMLSEAEAADYVKSLKAVSDGGKGAATHKEFAIIQAGIQQGWKVAQAMYKAGGKPLSAEMVATLTREGDSIEVGGGTELGGKANLNVKAVSVEVGVEESDEHSTKVTRNKEGTLDVDMSAGKTSKKSGKVGVSSGVVGGSFGKAHSVKTSTGYEITIDPKKDPDGKLFAALSACKSAADEEAFVAKYKDSITVKGKTVARAETDSEEVSLSVGPAKVALGLHSGVEEETKTDGKGKVTGKKVVGTAGGGGGVEVLGVGIGDSADDKATAESDADGNASLDLSRTREGTDFGKVAKLAKSKLPFVGDDKDKPKEGALSKAAGGAKEEDTKSRDVAGIKLTNKDLDRIGQIACTDEARWTHAAQRYQEYDDWKNAGRTIRAAKGERGVVAAELARFIGGDKINRLDMVNAFIRPGGDVSLGKAYDFPESLKGMREDYEKLVESPCEARIEQLAAKEGAQKAGEFGKKTFDTLEKLLQAFTKAKDFSKPAVKAEMLSAINSRKTLVLAAMRKVSGNNSADDEKKAAKEEYGRLLKECVQYEVEQNQLFDQVRELLGDRKQVLVANGDFAKASKHIKQLADLIAVWKNDYSKAAAMAKTVDMPESHYAKFQPNLAEFQRLKKACYM